ncbi:MAG TPA: hypothetical protein VK203_06395 [Nostocaceae cyanobacterium]|nr:hypothetical protein [Nostocaceae cyanobacterium]
MFIPGWLISLATFPGVVVHEAAHKFFCDLAKVPVYEVCYFRIGNPAGYVEHGKVRNLKDALLIAVGPLIINTILCAVLTYPVVLSEFLTKDADTNPLITFLLIWVGYSIGMHAFPSNEDIKNFLNVFKEIKKGTAENILYFFCQILALLFRIANLLRIVWFDFIYALIVSMALPLLLGNY